MKKEAEKGWNRRALRDIENLDTLQFIEGKSPLPILPAQLQGSLSLSPLCMLCFYF